MEGAWILSNSRTMSGEGGLRVAADDARDLSQEVKRILAHEFCVKNSYI